jgi:hypothetical protein
VSVRKERERERERERETVGKRLDCGFQEKKQVKLSRQAQA